MFVDCSDIGFDSFVNDCDIMFDYDNKHGDYQYNVTDDDYDDCD